MVRIPKPGGILFLLCMSGSHPPRRNKVTMLADPDYARVADDIRDLQAKLKTLPDGHERRSDVESRIVQLCQRRGEIRARVQGAVQSPSCEAIDPRSFPDYFCKFVRVALADGDTRVSPWSSVGNAALTLVLPRVRNSTPFRNRIVGRMGSDLGMFLSDLFSLSSFGAAERVRDFCSSHENQFESFMSADVFRYSSRVPRSARDAFVAKQQTVVWGLLTEKLAFRRLPAEMRSREVAAFIVRVLTGLFYATYLAAKE